MAVFTQARRQQLAHMRDSLLQSWNIFQVKIKHAFPSSNMWSAKQNSNKERTNCFVKWRTSFQVSINRRRLTRLKPRVLIYKSFDISFSQS
jgi:radical SAM superfamily enzyme with C-terminal helix-hairpin-helix motif